MRQSLTSCLARPIVGAHGTLRGQQRGIRRSARDIVLSYADREQCAGSGMLRLSLSRHEIRSLVAQGIITPQQADQCSRLTLVTDERFIVTNYRTSRTN